MVDRPRPGQKLPGEQIYVVRHGTSAAKLLGTGSGIAPSTDGRAAWISAYADRRHCRLRAVGLDARVRRAARPFPCGWLDPGGSLGLILHRRTRDELVDPDSLRTLLHAPRILAVAGTRVLTEDRAKGLMLVDTATGKRSVFRGRARSAAARHRGEPTRPRSTRVGTSSRSASPIPRTVAAEPR
jgi:hypothetical protein